MSEQYTACCIDDDAIVNYGQGKTPDEAYEEFLSGDFSDHCESILAEEGDDVEVYIYTHVTPEESDWPTEDVDPDWTWILKDKVETRFAKAI